MEYLFGPNCCFLRLFLQTPLGKFFVKRFVAGVNIRDGIDRTLELRDAGYKATLSYLGGEHLEDSKDVYRVFDNNCRLLRAIEYYVPGSDIAVKLSSFGLFSENNFKDGYKNFYRFKEFIEFAQEKKVFVWIDAEELRYRERTFDIISRLPRKNLGVCIQAYARDIEDFFDDTLPSDISVRICKGAYKEDPKDVVPSLDIIRDNFLMLIDLLDLMSSGKIQVATHDEALIEDVRRIYYRHEVSKEQMEFGFLLGRHSSLAIKKLIKNGYVANVYVPFGPKWVDFVVRRVQEKPSYLLMPFKK
ncbi:MAG: proline dehydrogenase family protein [Candidatus Marinimicrobia bacterium]|nr:proline dehydrogenase family protein [Candidatus Neomarinimicrobiota bacterium]